MIYFSIRIEPRREWHIFDGMSWQYSDVINMANMNCSDELFDQLDPVHLLRTHVKQHGASISGPLYDACFRVSAKSVYLLRYECSQEEWFRSGATTHNWPFDYM